MRNFTLKFCALMVIIEFSVGQQIPEGVMLDSIALDEASEATSSQDDRYLHQLQKYVEAYETISSEISQLQNLEISSSEHTPSFDKLPSDAVEVLKNATMHRWKFWYHQRSNKVQTRIQRGRYEQSFALFRHKMQGWIDKSVLDSIEVIIQSVYWDMEGQNHAKSIIQSKALTKELVEYIQEMSKSAYFYYYYKLKASKAYVSDASALQSAKDQKDLFDFCGESISAQVTIHSMKFKMEQAQVASTNILLVDSAVLNNTADEKLSMTFRFSRTFGKTTSTSTVMNFENKVSTGFQVGFKGYASANYTAQFNFETGHSFEQSISKQLTREYKFYVNVPPHNTYLAKAIIHEANMRIPYELVLAFGDARVKRTGLWQGVSSSNIQYDVSPA